MSQCSRNSIEGEKNYNSCKGLEKTGTLISSYESAWTYYTVPLDVLEQAPLDVPGIVRWLLGPIVLERTAVLSAVSAM